MKVKEYINASTYLDSYEAVLLEHEAVSQLILFNAYQNLYTSESEKCIFGTVMDDEDKTVLHFCNVEPLNLVIYCESQDKDQIISAAVAIADFITGNHISISGIIAKYDVCQSFITEYKKSINCNFVEKRGMDIMEIRKINEIKPVEGKTRLAAENESKLIADWLIQYQLESLASEMDYEAALKKANDLIENKNMYVYENAENKSVSMAATERKLKNGMAISMVFTPEEFRGKGYAAANIYFLSKELLENGCEFCTIFADKKNPVSNRAYEKVGYIILEENYDYSIMPAEVKPNQPQ